MIGPIARPKYLLFTPDLPKTRSGKIMRRLLRDIAEGRTLGDTTTLADASVVDDDPRQHRHGGGLSGMPFGLPAPRASPSRARRGPPPARPRRAGGLRGIPFDGLTEEWRLVGRMEIEGRLSDVLNRRESIPISDVHWAPIDGSEEFTAGARAWSGSTRST